MTQQEQDRKRLRETMEARRRRATGEEVVVEKEEPIVPKTFREKWQNFWFYYKNPVILGVIIAAIVVPFIFQLATPERYDATIIVSTEIPIDTAADPMREALIDYVQDYDGNGKPELKIIMAQLDVNSKYTGQEQMVEASIMKMAGYLSQHENFLFIVDKTAYDMIKSMGAVFVDLTQWTDAPCVEDGTLYYLNPTNLGKVLQMGEAKTDFYLAFLDVSVLPEKTRNNKKVVKAHEMDFQLLQSLLEAE